MKKLKLKDFLVKRLIIWFAVGIAVTAVMFGVKCVFGQFYAELASTNNTSEAVLRIEKSTSKDQAYMNLNMFFDSFIMNQMGFDAAAVIVDKETEEIYIDSEYNSVAIIKKEFSPTGEPLILINKSDDFIKTMTDFGPNQLIHFDIDSIYVDEDGFYPGTVTIGTLENDWDVMPENSEVYDFTPENASQLQKYTEGVFETALGTHPDSEALKIVKTAGKSYKTDIFEIYNTRSVTVNGKEYMIRAFYRLNFWDLVCKDVLISGIILMVICVGIALFTANNKYRKYITQYEIDEYRRNMTNALAHDLKSPLTAIYGYAENLKDNVHGEKREYYADAVLENVRYMNDIITNTLDLAKLEIGEKGVKQEKLDIAAISDELYKKYLPQAESRNIFFTASGSCTVTADKTLLTQALENLISNAVKFTSDNGRIEVTVSDRNYTITNDCDKSLKTENIGKPFGKSDKSRSNRTGSGLGLSIVKNITALHKFGFVTKAENGKFTAEITFGNK